MCVKCCGVFCGVMCMSNVSFIVCIEVVGMIMFGLLVVGVDVLGVEVVGKLVRVVVLLLVGNSVVDSVFVLFI